MKCSEIMIWFGDRGSGRVYEKYWAYMRNLPFRKCSRLGVSRVGPPIALDRWRFFHLTVANRANLLDIRFNKGGEAQEGSECQCHLAYREDRDAEKGGQIHFARESVPTFSS